MVGPPNGHAPLYGMVQLVSKCLVTPYFLVYEVCEQVPKYPFSKVYWAACQQRSSYKVVWDLLLWSSLKSTGSSSGNSSAYISASKQLNGSNTTVKFPELVSIEHQGATASRVLTSGSTSSRCLFPKLSMVRHLQERPTLALGVLSKKKQEHEPE